MGAATMEQASWPSGLSSSHPPGAPFDMGGRSAERNLGYRACGQLEGTSQWSGCYHTAYGGGLDENQ
jgi:hypothetical protein